MSDKRPISDEPKRAPKMIRVLFKPGTSTKDMAETLVRLQDEAMAKQGKGAAEAPGGKLTMAETPDPKPKPRG